MSGQALTTVQADADVTDVMNVMKRDRVRRVPVVEGDNRLVGIIAQADIAQRGPGDQEVGKVVEKISQPGARRNQPHGAAGRAARGRRKRGRE